MSNCKDDQCTGEVGPNFPRYTNNGKGEPKDTDGFFNRTNCKTQARDPNCSPFQLTKSNDSGFIDSLVNESLNVGGADIHVHKMLGVHEQCRTVDSTGKGIPISNGDALGYPMFNAFDVYVSEWHSVQKGSAVSASAFIGYDFGVIKTNDQSRRMYGVEASVRKNISALAIKQSPNQNNRVTRARIERSEDGVKWYGVSIVDLPDDDCLNTVLFDSSVTSRYWRIRPVIFNGGENDYWGVQALQLYHNYAPTKTSNIQDKILLENRDREYDKDYTLLKGSYDLVDATTELSRFGIETPSQSIYLTVSFSACVAALGRPLIIGDIIELPSEMQYSAEMREIRKWMEVTDVAWSTEGYTPGWQPTMLRVIMQPAYRTQENQDIFGDMAENDLFEELGLRDKGDGKNEFTQDYSDVSQEIQAQSKELVPEAGREGSSAVHQFTPDQLAAAKEHGINNMNKLGLNPSGLYVEDAMPPNNAPFTEGTSFPEKPKNKDYHRLTYENLDDYYPARLYRYSSAKGRWIFLETDKRDQYNSDKPRLEEFLKSPDATDYDNITNKEK